MYLTQNLDYHMVPKITRPTRITHNSATLIDNLFVSQKLQDKYKSSILINDFSDHLPCYVILPDETGLKSPFPEKSDQKCPESRFLQSFLLVFSVTIFI